MSLMLKECTQFMASSTFLEMLSFLGEKKKREFKSSAQKIVADRAWLKLVEMNAVWMILEDLASGQK